MFYGKWITAENVSDNLHIVFEKRITVGNIKNAKIRITADDYYKLYINGRFVGQGPAPSYSFRYRFNEYDVSECLVEGENDIRVLAYYQGLKNRVWLSGDGILGMIADIFADGDLLCSTDESWSYRVDRTFIGGEKLGYDTAYTENRDLTRGLSEAKNAVVTDCPHSFDNAPLPSVDTYEISVEPIINGNKYFYDFTREYVCCPVIKATSENDGARIILRFAEELNPDGSLRYDMRCGCKYEEICTLKKGENVIEQFDYKALRYAEIIADGGVKIDGVKLLVRHFPFPEISQEITVENDALRAVFDLCKSTIKYGVQEGFIDCPTREKGQYLGDAYITGFAHYYLTKDSRLLRKALYDFADSVELCGKFLSVAPCSYRQKIADYDLLYPHMMLKYCELTGDLDTVRKLLPTCEHIIKEYEKFTNITGLLENVTDGWNLVDWPENMRDGYEYGGEGEYGLHSVINAFYIFAKRSINRLCELIGRDYYGNTNELIRAFNNEFFDDDTGLYVDCKGSGHNSVHANILPLAFGICDEKNKEGVADYLIKRGMACSVYMSYFYLTALCNSGHKAEALDAIISPEKHGWLNMINVGATATFEAWRKDEKHNTSLFHPWATAPILLLNEHFPGLLSFE